MSVSDLSHLIKTFDDELNTFTSSPDGSSGNWTTAYPFGSLASVYPIANAQDRELSGELEYYSDGSVGVNPFSDNNGVLNIQAAPAAPNSTPYNAPYTSGVITTYSSFTQTYGFFEISAKLPPGQGIFPGFWLLPQNNLGNAEIDALELKGQAPTQLLNTAINSNVGLQAVTTIPDATQAFHTYGVDWEPNTITYYFDGVPTATLPTPANANSAAYILIDLSIGAYGSFAGPPDGTTPFPANLQIDWVRAFATGNTVLTPKTGNAGGSLLAPTAPAILGEFGTVGSVDGTGFAPFANAEIEDTSGYLDTVTVSVSDTTHGYFANLLGWLGGNGVYSFTGTAAAVSTAIQGLDFIPVASGAGTLATTFTLNASNFAGAASAATTTVNITHALQTLSAQTIDGRLAPSTSAPLTFTDTGTADTIWGSRAGLNLTANGPGDTIFTLANTNNTLALNNTNETVASYGNDTIGGSGQTNWLLVYGAYTNVNLNSTLTTVDLEGTGETVSVSGYYHYITADNAVGQPQTLNLYSISDYVGADAGLLTINDYGGGTTINGASGGVNVTLASSYNKLTTAAGATDQVLINTGSKNTVNANGNDTITVKAGGQTVIQTANATIYDYSGANAYGLSGNASLTAGQGYEYLAIGGGGIVTAAVTSNNTVVITGSGSVALTETGASNSVQFGGGVVTVSEGPGGNTYNFVSGHGGGTDTISSFKSGVDQLVYSGFAGNAVQSQGVVNGATSILLVDGTHILLPGTAAPTSSGSTSSGSGGSSGTSSGTTSSGSTGGIVFVGAGQTSTGLVLGGGSGAFVNAGGSVVATTVTAGGLLAINGGVATATAVGAGGNEFVLAGGNVGAFVQSGALLTVSGGTDQSTTISGGGAEVVFGGVVSGAAVLAAGQLSVAGGTAAGTLVSGGGTLVVGSAGAATGTALFNGARLDLAGLAYGANGTASLNNNVLTVTEKGVSVSEALAGNYANASFALSADAASGTLVTVTVAAAAATRAPVNYFVNAGQTSSGIVLSAGDGAFVAAGGTVANTTVTSGGLLDVVSGAANSAVVQAGGNLFVLAGTDTAATVGSGGVLTVSGGVDAGAFLAAGAIEIVNPGGTVAGATVASGATLAVVGNGFVSGTTLLGGSRLDLASLRYTGVGSASYNPAYNTLTVTQGGAAVVEGIVGGAGASYAVSADSSGGTVVTTTAGAALPRLAGSTFVGPGQTENGFVLSAGDIAFVNPGGAAANLTVSNGGTLAVNGGSATGTTVLAGGNEFVLAGSDGGAAVGAGGVLTISGGSATGATIGAGGSAAVFGGVLSGATANGGTINAVGGGITSGTVLGSGAMEFVGAGSTANGTTVSNGGIQVDLNGGITLNTHLQIGGSLDLTAVSFAGLSNYAFNNATNTLTFTSGTTPLGVSLGGNYAGTGFHYNNDGKGGLLVTAVTSGT